MRQHTRPFGFGGWRWELLSEVRGHTLEVGCGWGHNFAHYPSEVAVSAFDLNPERVSTAGRRQASVALSVADAQQLAWAAHTFDTVVGSLVFCSIPRPEQALAEIRRVLKPTGRLFLLEHVRSHHEWLGQLQDGLAPAWLWATGGCHLNRDTETTVRAAGFAIERRVLGYGGLLKLMITRPH